MCFAITEPFILQIFQNFLTNMDPDVYYKPEEAEQIIKHMIEQLKTINNLQNKRGTAESSYSMTLQYLLFSHKYVSEPNLFKTE